MAVTLLDIRNEILEFTSDFYASDTNKINRQINNTREQISNLVKIADLLKTSVISTIDDIQSYNLPTDFKYEIYVYNTTQKEILPLIVPDIELDIKKDLPEKSKPSGYHIRGKKIMFFPIPDGAYNINILYYSKPMVLTADTDTDYLNDEYKEAIVYGTVARIFNQSGAFDLVNQYYQLYQIFLDERGYIEKLNWQEKILQFKKRFAEIAE